MQIITSLLPPQDASSAIEPADVAVVIDVLRATSVMATALQAGAKRIITVGQIEAAIELADHLQPRPLLCGERQCVRIPGFDLGNSPAEYGPEQVQGKTLVLTTTNGTAAIERTGAATAVITACFLNFSAVVATLARYRTVHFLCAGTDGQITDDDVLLAGGLIVACEAQYGAHLINDDSQTAQQLWQREFGTDVIPTTAQLARFLRETRGARNLVRLGYESDIERCAQLDQLSVVPHLRGNKPHWFASDPSRR
jgi:2-phosphosulfolactate phosphatase